MDRFCTHKWTKLFLITAVFIFINCLLDLKFGHPGEKEALAVNVRIAEPEKLTFSRNIDFQDFVSVSDENIATNDGPIIQMRQKRPKIEPRFEVSHTPIPEKYVPINQTYFIPRQVVINDFYFEYFSEPICNDVFLLMFICSKHEHFQYRRAIRDTWGSISQYQRKIKLIFLLGQHFDEYWNDNVLKEMKTFNDILITNTRESYENLTIKVIAGLNWMKRHCRAEYVMKSDEDMVVNVPCLIQLLKIRPIENSILGSVNTEAPVMRTNKWKVDKALYPYSVYPPYVSGNSYVISFDAAEKIIDVFRYMPLIKVEDAFITGILAKVAGVKLMSDKRFTYWGTPMITVCDFIENRMISGTHMTPKILYRFWKAVSKRKCR